MSTLFSAVTLAPRDPILGLNEAFNADARTTKVNLGVGVYFDDKGKIPLLGSIKTAEKTRVEAALPRGYLPIDGIVAYKSAVQHLLFGEKSPLLAANRALTVQALGGTGALKVGADYLQQLLPNSAVYISDPSWENHRAIFESAGFQVNSYAYYDEKTKGVNFAGMKNALNALPEHAIVVLHACCHNPTGADLSAKEWQEVVQIAKAKKLVAFLDIAYQGFADGLTEDAIAVQLFAESGLPFLVASSFSKSFSLYGERVGALTIVTDSADETARVLSQVKRVIRSNYSNPPTHGGALVAAVLASPELRKQWEDELGQMRVRIREMRKLMVEKLKAKIPNKDFSFILAQRGMFSYTGLSASQVERLQSEFGVYAVSTGRICMAALNTQNIDYVVESIAAVL